MKKKNLMMMLGLLGFGFTANAQVIASLGFEADETQKYVDPDSIAAGKFTEFCADHINLGVADVWNEEYTEDVHSGSYALQVDNSGMSWSNSATGNAWDRGLKLRGLNIEPETSYRVSFWVKAPQTFNNESGEPVNTVIKSTLSIGIENLEAPFVSQSGTQYYYNYADGIMTGEWRRISFVSYYSGKDVQNSVFDDFNNNIKEITADGDTIYYGEEYSEFPDKFFLTINMYNPTTYLLDDITIEKATMAGCTYNYDAIRVDFGYPTNAAQLAVNSTDPIGTYLLPASCVKVTNGEEELAVNSVELKDDGYMYIFMAEEIDEATAANMRVSFTPAEDCPVVYNTDRRPSMDVTSEMKVLAFENEAVYYDETIDAMSYLMDGPIYLSSVPEDHSFELDLATFTEVRVTYDRPVSTEIASIQLLRGNNELVQDLSKETVTDSNDPNTLVVPISGLEDGEYYLRLTNVTNAMSGFECLTSQTINFSVGPDQNPGETEEIYKSDEFATTANGTFPVGWASFDNGVVHEYGLNEDSTVWNYNWGGVNPLGAGGGPRMMTGYSGDFQGGAIYWRSTAGNVGTLTFGAQVANHVLPDGTLDVSNMDPRIALYLTPRKYQFSFRMAAWKADDVNGKFPKYDFYLEKVDLARTTLDNQGAPIEANVVASAQGVTARPNVNGAQNITVTGATLSTAEFVVDEAGYYMMKFYSDNPDGGQNNFAEFLLGNVQVVAKPSDASYYKAQLQAAVDSANVVLNQVENEAYNGTTKTNLLAAVDEAGSGKFNSPSTVGAICDSIYSLCGQMLTRQTNVDSYDTNLQNLRNAMANIDASTKYALTEEYVACSEVLAKYDGVTAQSLEDADLITANEELTKYGSLAPNIKSSVDALTAQLDAAVKTATKIETVVEPASLVDDARNALFDDADIVREINGWNKYRIYQLMAEGGTIAPEYRDTIYSETKTDESGAYVVATSGIEVTGFVKNPDFYTYATSTADTLDLENTPGWETLEGFAHLRDGYLSSDTRPVAKSMINMYRGDYSIGQKISGLPVGIYDVCFRTRTADGKYGVNDETGIPDMYIWASTVEGDTLRTGFEQGTTKYNADEGFPTIIAQVKVTDENTVLSIGAKEDYTSGKNLNGEGVDEGIQWDTNTYVNEVRLVFVAPLPGFDYNAAMTDVNSVKAEPVSYEYYTVDGIKLDRPVKGLNVVKIHRADGTVDVEKKIME